MATAGGQRNHSRGTAASQLAARPAGVILLCSLVAFLDGFDTQSIAPAAGSIARELALPLAALGLLFGASQLGFLVGAMLFSPAGDRMGRKRILLVTTALFALASLTTAFAGFYSVLLACRVLAGMGLGGATPNFLSLASENSPPEHRARVVTMLWAAVPLGGMTGSFAGAALIPLFGWKSVFLLGGAAPLLLLPVLQARLPESSEVRLPAPQGLAFGGAQAGTSASNSLARLFGEHRAMVTLLLWTISFMTWTTVVAVAFWTPTLLQRAGVSSSTAASMLALNNAGGVVGTLLIGAMLRSADLHRTVSWAFTGAGLFIAGIGGAASALPLLALAAILAGFCSSAATGGVLAVSAETYPASARTTGVGWALGVGRIGSIVGPLATGAFISHAFSVAHVYLVLSFPPLVAAALILLLERVHVAR